MVSGSTNTVGFEKLAEQFDDLESKIDEILEESLKSTGDEIVKEIVNILQAEKTSKGGTYDSRSSKYEPGGTNDSSSDNLHLATKDAWKREVSISDGEHQVSVTPKEAVDYRARKMNYGTSDIEPKGDTPMYFKVDSYTVVVSDQPERLEDEIYSERIQRQFDGEPQSIDGVEGNYYFQRAVILVVASNFLDRELSRRFRQAASEVGLDV